MGKRYLLLAAALSAVAALAVAGFVLDARETFERVGSVLDAAPGAPAGDPPADDMPADKGAPPSGAPAPSSPDDSEDKYAPKDKHAPEADALMWQAVKDVDHPAAFEMFLNAYPDSVFAPMARLRLEQLGTGQGTSGAPQAKPEPQPAQPASPGLPAAPAGRASSDFPWPPPRASARYVIPAERLGISQDLATVGDIADAIVSALDGAGYFDRSYFELARGAAIVTRLERIGADGYPASGDARWPLSVADQRAFSLGEMLKNLFFAEPGYFRVIAFVITDEAFREGDQPPSAAQATEWLNKGFNKLPESSARRAGAQHVVTALIYEFAREGEDVQARQLVPGQIPGATHLQRAGILAGAR